jgi:capsular exopolysaccharide synthesis family protein
MADSKTKVSYTPVSGKTSLVDRMNLSIHLRKYIKLFTRRWIILFLTTGIAAGYTWHKSRELPDIYRAGSRIGFSQQVHTPSGRSSGVVLDPQTEFIDTQLALMKGGNVLSRVQERLKDYKPPSGLPPTAEYSVAKGLGLAFDMTVTGNDYEYVRRFVEYWAEEFIASRESTKGDKVAQELGEARLNLDRTRERLNELFQKREEFLKKHNAPDAKNRGQAATDNLNRLQQEQLDLQTRRKRLENQKFEDLIKNTGEFNPSPAPKRPADNASQAQGTSSGVAPRDKFTSASRYSELDRALQLALIEHSRWTNALTPNHPHMVAMEAEIKDLQTQIDLEFKRLKAMHDADIATLKQQELALNPIIEEWTVIAAEARRIEREYADIEDKYQRELRQADHLESKVRELEGIPREEETLFIIEAGVGNSAPIGPDRRKMIINGVLVGLALGLGIIYFLHRLDDRLELAEDIEEELEEPVLGQIPQLGKEFTNDGHVLITRLEQHNTFAESLRGVRSALLFGSREVGKQVIVVTSAVPGDGKTTITANFAATLAKAGNRVLLVDSDLRRGNIHTYFGFERDHGFTEVLSGEAHWQEVVQPTEIDTLHTITTGRLPGNPGELLISPVTQQFIEEARKHYDHILFDCPPLTSIDDTFCLLSFVDGLLFVVKAGHTSMRFAKNALNAVRHRGAGIIGIILNGITTDHPGYYYYYYYHDYYKSAQEGAARGEKLPDSRPAARMAPKRRGVASSIDQAARASAGLPAAVEAVTSDEQRKADAFRARRASKRDDSPPSKPEEPSPDAPITDGPRKDESPGT